MLPRPGKRTGVNEPCETATVPVSIVLSPRKRFPYRIGHCFPRSRFKLLRVEVFWVTSSPRKTRWTDVPGLPRIPTRKFRRNPRVRDRYGLLFVRVIGLGPRTRKRDV